ncbi:MAG TPA: outer membrane lipoprotein carrier protein LolA [Bacteroidales bacterium]|jgi:outer membrane lipoprotein-sorting protein|nr:outer membrane lipoprotein carrier protein LolA [Bacteroidales bacterium]HOL98220.1 outer membrane lipoprotein carrier protein LolA [Bacteroidales bacterium]HOM36443.1 outer membrane lipoprotein carrier protein LolA [Bacteroidales bacterium]HPD23883.1 outer membrane lipoprotein carrier protein LolA [Bacteroidales bacterium]HRS99954.1 outer membrane lipoprotein carrier protein LolA [Bacteroidales bacterium]
MKKFGLFFLAIFCFYFLDAQTQNNDNTATALLDEVAAKAERYTSLKIDFNMFVENLHSGKRDSYSGNAMYKSGNYKLDVMGQVVYSDGKTNYTYLKDADEINISKNDSQSEMINPQAFLKDYKNNYKVKYIAEKFEKNRPLVEIDLFPKNIENKKYSRITIKVDKTKKQIYSVRYIGKDGVNYLIEITKFEENPVIQDNQIKFSKDLYPSVEIIDLR